MAGDTGVSWLRWAVLAIGIGAIGWIILGRRYRLDARIPSPRLDPLVAIGLYVGLWFGGLVGAMLAHMAFQLPPPDESTDTLRDQVFRYGGYLAGSIPAIAAVVWLRSDRRHPGATPRATRRRAAILGGLSLGVVWPAVAAVTMTGSLVIGLISGSPPPEIAHDTLRQVAERGLDPWTITIIAMVVLGGPVVEEVLYRGLLQGCIMSLYRLVHQRRASGGTVPAFMTFIARPWFGIAIVSAIFAANHLPIAEPHAVIGLFILSLGFGWVKEKTGRLTAPIVMHVLFNAGNVALALM